MTPWAMDVLQNKIDKLLTALAASDARGDILAAELAKSNIARDTANARSTRLAQRVQELVDAQGAKKVT
jgi:hypothetical protein